MNRLSTIMAVTVALIGLLSPTHAYVMDSRRWDSGAITMHLNLDTAPLPRALADGSTSWGQVAQQALSEWNAVISRAQFVAVQNSSAPVGRQNGVNNVFFSPTVYGEAWGSGVVGLTITVMQGSGSQRRAESDVLFNSNAPMDSYRGPLGSAGPWYDFKRLALHEFGHVLGLGHPDDAGQKKASVMNSAISDTDRLMDDDIEGAQSAYGVPAGFATGLAPSVVSVNGGQSAVVGSRTTLSVVAQGTGPFTYQWKKDGLLLAEAIGPNLVLEPVNVADAGTYTVTISNALGSVSTLVGQLNVVTPPPARLVNLSVRTMQAANQTLVVGLTAVGKPVPVLLRAVGPTLAAFGVAGAMPDPSLTVFKASKEIDSNDNWGGSTTLSQAFLSAGAFSLQPTSLDAALVRSIEGGNTVQVSSATGGVVLVEAYELSAPADSGLVNLSARTRVGTGADALVAGFTIVGGSSKTVLIRGIGPALESYGVTGVLVDPKLELFSGSSSIGENDSWDASLAPVFSKVGAFALSPGSKDAAIVVTLAPGSYTVQLTGREGGTGEGMIEVYAVD
jgi:hypothetical protein